jgi:hypothetical protein
VVVVAPRVRGESCRGRGRERRCLVIEEVGAVGQLRGVAVGKDGRTAG